MIETPNEIETLDLPIAPPRAPKPAPERFTYAVRFELDKRHYGPFLIEAVDPSEAVQRVVSLHKDRLPMTEFARMRYSATRTAP